MNIDDSFCLPDPALYDIGRLLLPVLAQELLILVRVLPSERYEQLMQLVREKKTLPETMPEMPGMNHKG